MSLIKPKSSQFHNNINLSVNNLDAYIRYAYSIPCLTKDEEYKLALEWQEKQNLQAAQRLVLSHIRYVIRIAKSYMGYGLNLADLIQEGTIGLMRAVKKFNISHEVRLVTFAMHWIKSEIHEFIIRNCRIVKIATTKAQRKLFFKLRSKKKRLNWLSKKEISEISNDLGVKEKDIIQMESRISFNDTSFDLPVDDTEKNTYTPSSINKYLSDQTQNPAQLLENSNLKKYLKEKLIKGLMKLDQRSAYIMKHRWLNTQKKATTLEELSRHFLISKERVRQIESKAIKQLRDIIMHAH